MHHAFGISLAILIFSMPVIAAPTRKSTIATRTKTHSAAAPHLHEHLQKAHASLASELTSEAIEIISQTEMAILANSKNQKKAALNALSKADLNVKKLLKKYPRESILLVDFNIEIIDLAPKSRAEIKEIIDVVDKLKRDKNFPVMRETLNNLISEVHIRKYGLPLGAFDDAVLSSMKLIKNSNHIHSNVLMVGMLNSLVVDEISVPIPFIEAKIKINEAEIMHTTDPILAKSHLDMAKADLERAELLGYMSASREDFKILKDQIDETKKHIDDDQRKTPAFENLRKEMQSMAGKHLYEYIPKKAVKK